MFEEFSIEEIFNIIKPVIEGRAESLRIADRPDFSKETGWGNRKEICFQTKQRVYGIHIGHYYDSDKPFISFSGSDLKNYSGFGFPVDTISELLKKLDEELPPLEKYKEGVQLTLF